MRYRNCADRGDGPTPGQEAADRPSRSSGLPAGPIQLPGALQEPEVVHFIDNTSALAGCIKGGSSVDDSNVIFQLLSLRLAELGTRYWAEYVESLANLADEPSRADGHCPVAEGLGARVTEVFLPPLSAFHDSAVSLLSLSDLLRK